ncbi:MAG: hypothetical protein WA160_14455 [Pseudobdellovibrio sp.]
MIWLLVAGIIFISVHSQAQAVHQIQRQELFELGNESLSFFLGMAYLDNQFVATLTAEERRMLLGTSKISSVMNSIRWLQKHKAQRYPQKDGFFYAYTVFRNEVVQLTTQIDRPIQLQFSDDQKIFILDPNEPSRTAMTETALDKDIYINLQKINDAKQDLDLANVVSLLIHEYGHKLAQQKNQQAVNSFAAKMENYIRSMTNTTEIQGKKISTLIFKNFPFYRWIENIYYGEDVGSGKPRAKQALTVVDGQGAYVWVEDKNKITNLTPLLIAQASKNEFINFQDQPNYHFLRQNVILPTSLVVSPIENNQGKSTEQFKLILNANVGQIVLPFMKNGSFNPLQYELMQKAFRSMVPWLEKDQSQELKITSDYKFKSAKPIVHTFTMPQFKVTFLDKKLKGDNLEIYYKIDGETSLPVLETDKVVEHLWPQITVQINNTQVVLKANDFYPKNSEYKFVLKNFSAIVDSDVKIADIHFKATGENLAVANSDLMAKSFLPSETIIARKKQQPLKRQAPQLKSIQTWDGEHWISLKNKAFVPKGHHLRFIFTANEPLRELLIDQSFVRVTNAKVWTPGSPAKDIQMLKEPEQRSIRFAEESMRQTIHGNTLYVDINIDHKLPTESTVIQSDEMDFIFRQLTGVTMPIEPEVMTTFYLNVDPARQIMRLHFVSRSGEGLTIDLKNPLNFVKPSGDQSPEASSMRFKKMRCEYLFN